MQRLDFTAEQCRQVFERELLLTLEIGEVGAERPGALAAAYANHPGVVTAGPPAIPSEPRREIRQAADRAAAR